MSLLWPLKAFFLLFSFFFLPSFSPMMFCVPLSKFIGSVDQDQTVKDFKCDLWIYEIRFIMIGRLLIIQTWCCNICFCFSLLRNVELIFNSFPHDNIFFYSSKLRELSDDNFNFDKNSAKFSKRVKTRWEKEKLLVTSNFSFYHSVFKRLAL